VNSVNVTLPKITAAAGATQSWPRVMVNTSGLLYGIRREPEGMRAWARP
jgi:hypothetical protein